MNEEGAPKIFSTSAQQVLQCDEAAVKLNYTVSAYPNCVFVVINETGSIGSVVSFLQSRDPRIG